MLCILLFNQPVQSYIPYSLNRIFDTGVGVVIALLLNWLLPRHRIVYILEKITGGRYKAHENLEHPRPKK